MSSVLKVSSGNMVTRYKIKKEERGFAGGSTTGRGGGGQGYSPSPLHNLALVLKQLAMHEKFFDIFSTNFRQPRKRREEDRKCSDACETKLRNYAKHESNYVATYNDKSIYG